MAVVTKPSDMGSTLDAAQADQHRALWLVLLLNVGLAIAFGIAGVLADASALIANRLDNGSDGIVYGISLVALSRSQQWEAAAGILGIMLLIFAVSVLIDVGRRYIQRSEPVGVTMITMSIVAAGINYYCLLVLPRLDKPNVNMRAATTLSFNDLISNGGIVVAGVIIYLTGANWPGLLVGFGTALIALKGHLEILRDARKTAKYRRGEAT